VREAERMRIARDLHDELGYRLMALILEIDRLTCRYQATERLADDMARIRSYLVQTATAIHDIAVNLSSRDLADLGLPAALANLGRQSEAASGIRILVSASGELESLPPEVALVAYRITQEALTNALKYADASTITISASLADGRLTLTITDDGIGCGALDPGTAGRPALGIRGMRERAAAIGGRLELISRPGQGATVRASLPVEA
jgi:two-component system sensor histidine kinase UhpB